MRRMLFVALSCLFVGGAAFALNITVASPNGGESWQLGTTQTITWTYAGTPSAMKVKLVLWKNGAKIGDIVEDLPSGGSGTGSYPWSVGAYIGGTAIAESGYKIRIRAMNDPNVMDESNQPFTITAPPGAPPGKLGVVKKPGIKLITPQPIIPLVRIPLPTGSGSYMQLDTIPIQIKANTGPPDGSGDGFDVDLYNEQGTAKVTGIHSGGIPQASPGVYSLAWTMPRMDNVPDGKYTVRARSWMRKDITGLSAPFWIRIPGTEEKISIQAVIAGTWTWKKAPSDAEGASTPPAYHVADERPGEARIGFYNDGSSHGDNYLGIIYRAKMHFPMDNLAHKLVRFTKATLRLKQTSFGVRKNVGYRPWTIGNILVLNAPWNDFWNTPTSIFKLVPTAPGPEWTVDITNIVRDWLNGTKPNHGLLLTSYSENWFHVFQYAVSFYQGTIDLTFFNPVC